MPNNEDRLVQAVYEIAASPKAVPDAQTARDTSESIPRAALHAKSEAEHRELYEKRKANARSDLPRI
jgi:hypothetical protein